MVRESKSPHTTPTFCVRKPNGKWRIVHAYNKLNAATIPSQTPIPRKDVLQNNMVGCTQYRALGVAGHASRALERSCDVQSSSDAVISSPPGVAQTYFDDIFVHSQAEEGKTDVEVHIEHLRAVLECMRTNKLYANADTCVFGAEEIPFLGCFIGKRGLRADPAKVKAIVD